MKMKPVYLSWLFGLLLSLVCLSCSERSDPENGMSIFVTNKLALPVDVQIGTFQDRVAKDAARRCLSLDVQPGPDGFVRAQFTVYDSSSLKAFSVSTLRTGGSTSAYRVGTGLQAVLELKDEDEVTIE